MVPRSWIVTQISIHAPRAGSDYIFVASTEYSFNFNPRSPCGERPITFRGVKFLG